MKVLKILLILLLFVSTIELSSKDIDTKILTDKKLSHLTIDLQKHINYINTTDKLLTQMLEYMKEDVNDKMYVCIRDQKILFDGIAIQMKRIYYNSMDKIFELNVDEAEKGEKQLKSLSELIDIIYKNIEKCGI